MMISHMMELSVGWVKSLLKSSKMCITIPLRLAGCCYDFGIYVYVHSADHAKTGCPATLTFAEAVRIIDILLSRVWTCKTKSCSSLCGGVSTGFTALLHCDNYCIVGNFGEH